MRGRHGRTTSNTQRKLSLAFSVNVLRISNNMRSSNQCRTHSSSSTGKDRESEASHAQRVSEVLQADDQISEGLECDFKDSGNQLSHTSHKIHLRNLPSTIQHQTSSHDSS